MVSHLVVVGRSARIAARRWLWMSPASRAPHDAISCDAAGLQLAVRPSLIVSDIMMPGMSGTEMITAIRTRSEPIDLAALAALLQPRDTDAT